MAFDLTFVIPFRNEERFLKETCESLARQELGKYTAEILMVDGMSSDQSRDIVEQYERTPSENLVFRLILNRKIRTPFGFNLGIETASGNLIGFGGAHTIYPQNYFTNAIELANSIDAHVFGGGTTDFLTDKDGIWAQGMSCLYLSPMGSGVAAYHQKTGPGYVDTVYGGFYRREVFDRVGVFDTRLSKNQDNELNSRVTRAGLKIFFDPRLSVSYVFKTDFRTFVGRAFKFGKHHPITWKLNPRSFKLRHAVPLFFVLYLIVIFPMYVFFGYLVFFPLAFYGALMLGSVVSLARYKPAIVALTTFPLFFLFHLSYGLGTIGGLFKLLISTIKCSNFHQEASGKN